MEAPTGGAGRDGVITKEAFDEWRESDVTVQVLLAVRALADGCKAEWLANSWGGGNVDLSALAALKAKEQVANDLAEIEFEDLEAWLTQQQNSE